MRYKIYGQIINIVRDFKNADFGLKVRVLGTSNTLQPNISRGTSVRGYLNY